MPSKKNNHFVPKFYLKYFAAGDMRSIDLYNIDTQQIHRNCSIKNQASKPYLYGKYTQTESFLTDLETMAAPVIKSIISEVKIPTRVEEGRLRLLAFIMNQRIRVPKHLNEIDDHVDYLAKLVLSHNQEYLDKYGHDQLTELRVGIENSSTFVLSNNALTFLLLNDLSIKLLRNRTERPFITSDNPVVFYNEFFRSSPNKIAGVGVASKGLQIIFPLTPVLTLFAYDKDVYKVGEKKSEVVTLDDLPSIDLLNMLQIINCQNNLYYHGDIPLSYFQEMRCEVASVREKVKSSVKEIPHQTDPNRSLLVTESAHIKGKFSFAFTKLLKKAKRLNAAESQEFIRNPRALAEFEAFIENWRRQGMQARL